MTQTSTQIFQSFRTKYYRCSSLNSIYIDVAVWTLFGKRNYLPQLKLKTMIKIPVESLICFCYFFNYLLNYFFNYFFNIANFFYFHLNITNFFYFSLKNLHLLFLHYLLSTTFVLFVAKK